MTTKKKSRSPRAGKKAATVRDDDAAIQRLHQALKGGPAPTSAPLTSEALARPVSDLSSGVDRETIRAHLVALKNDAINIDLTTNLDQRAESAVHVCNFTSALEHTSPW